MVAFSDSAHKLTYKWCNKQDICIKYTGAKGQWALFEIIVENTLIAEFSILRSHSWNRRKMAEAILRDSGWEVHDEH